MPARLPQTSREAATNAVVDRLDGAAGELRIYSGAEPAADGPEGTVLVVLDYSDPAFGPSAADGTATANAIAQGTGVADGTATWFRAYNGLAQPVFQGDVGTTGSGASLELISTAINIGEPVNVTAQTYQTPEVQS